VLGGFNEQLKTGEDFDFCARAKFKGVECEMDSGFRAIHLGYPGSIPKFFRRELWHGEGDFKNLNTFLNSKIAMISIVYLLSVLSIVMMLVCGLYVLAVVEIMLLITVNIWLTAMRFSGSPIRTVMINSVLN